MTKQIRLEAIKLAITLSGNYDDALAGAARIAEFIERGTSEKAVEAPDIPADEEPGEASTMQTRTRRRRAS